MKKIISVITALAVCASVSACAGGQNDTTEASRDTLGTTADISTTESSSNTDITISPIQDIEVRSVDNDVVALEVGKYATIMYNPAYCDIRATVESGVGSRESVTVNIEMKEGYIFDGWSSKDAISNGGKSASKSMEYKVSLSKETTLWANYSANIVYHANGGTVKKDGSDTYTQKASVVWYKCPNTLTAEDNFVNEGYTLVEYNTKADGTGTAISLGSRVAMHDRPSVELYCIWEKQSSASDFEYRAESKGLYITKYKGSDKNVVIPDTIDGKTVIGIAEKAFNGSSVERVVLTKNITNVDSGAFTNCRALKTFVMFDSLVNISDRSFSGTNIENLRINAVLGLYKSWTTSFANVKLDRLLWAQNSGKDIMTIYGGSGSYYGFDCSIIDEAFDGRYEIVNLGSNASVTAAFYFEYLEKIMGEGDIALWAPEAGNYMLGEASFSSRLWEFNGGHYDILRNIDISNYNSVFSTYSTYASSHSGNQQSFEAFSTGTDMYGDSASSGEHKERYNSYSFSRYISFLNGSSTDHLSDIMKNMSANGVKILYTWPAMDKEGSFESDEMMKEYENALKKAFPNLEIISEYKDCLIDHEYMLDSEWHLVLDGAKIRTQSVVEFLNTYFEKEG